MENGAGYSLFRRRDHIVWTCNTHISLAKTVYNMNKNKLSNTELECLLVAGDSGGQYLDQIGKTDLAKLGPEEWQLFLTTILTAYGEAMSVAVGADKAPF